VQRIAVIGNAGGGKTTLSRLLGDAFALPVHHVDSIQYQRRWVRTPSAECDRRLDDLIATDRWVIDGFGSDGAIERRLRAADLVVFVEFPLAVHYWWACKRQWQNRQRQRAELPDDCPEFTLEYSWKLARVMWEVHRCYRPWFAKLVKELPDDVMVFHIRSPREWREFVSRRVKPGHRVQPDAVIER
jgi:adenylate kinase family enzyme